MNYSMTTPTRIMYNNLENDITGKVINLRNNY